MAAKSDVRKRTAKVQDIGSEDETDEEEEIRRNTTTFGKVTSWAWCLAWIVGAAVSLKHSDLVGVLLHSTLIRRFVLYLSLLILSVTVTIGVYLTLTSDPADYDHVVLTSFPYKPKAIPVATFFWVFGSVLFAIALWPVYHILTLPLMFVIFMGFIHILNLIPGQRSAKKLN